jgi:hypothetical protein
MKNNSMFKLGSVASFLSALFLLTYLIGGALRPEAQNSADINAYLLSLAENSTFTLILFWSGAFYGLFAIAVVMATSDLVRNANEGLVRWTSTLAIIGYAVAVIWYFALQQANPGLAAEYSQADETTRSAVALIGPISLDPQFWMSYGITGLWFIVMNWLANRGDQLPKFLTYLGMVAGIASWLVVAGSALGSGGLETAGFVLSSFTLIIWYVWTGSVLRRLSSQKI